MTIFMCKAYGDYTCLLLQVPDPGKCISCSIEVKCVTIERILTLQGILFQLVDISRICSRYSDLKY